MIKFGEAIFANPTTVAHNLESLVVKDWFYHKRLAVTKYNNNTALGNKGYHCIWSGLTHLLSVPIINMSSLRQPAAMRDY